MHSALQGFDLGFAQLAGYGMKLAVDVTDANIIQIYQGQLAHPGARERLDGPRTNAANANHADVSLA
jgi:hypothetical protein